MAITLEEAQEIICEQAVVVDSEKVPAVFCAGRILAEDVTASVDQPPFSRSAMDGYAVRSEDTRGASRENPVRLKVVRKVYAGDGVSMGGDKAGDSAKTSSRRTSLSETCLSEICLSETPPSETPPSETCLGRGEAVRIMTGGMIPEGADCVIRQEDTDQGEETVEIYQEAFPWMNYCRKGEDFCAGEVLAVKGMALDAYGIGTISAAGIQEVWVRRRIRAAIVTTGDELCLPGETLKSGKIYDSNRAYLMARLMQLGCEVSGTYMAADGQETICGAIRQARENSDFIITTGGVSVGEKDLLPKVMEDLHASVKFHGVAVKPGMPTMFSVFDGVPVLSLSGNPYSASVMFELLARPLFTAMGGAMGGETNYGLRSRTGILSNDFHKKSPKRRFLRGVYDGGHVYIPEKQSNGQLKAEIGTNCFIDIPAGTGELAAGDQVKILLL